MCKNALSIIVTNDRYVSEDGQKAFETCLIQNYLIKDPNYFGKRNLIYLDMYGKDDVISLMSSMAENPGPGLPETSAEEEADDE